MRDGGQALKAWVTKAAPGTFTETSRGVARQSAVECIDLCKGADIVVGETSFKRLARGATAILDHTGVLLLCDKASDLGP